MQLLPSSWFHLLRPQSLSYVCVASLCVSPILPPLLTRLPSLGCGWGSKGSGEVLLGWHYSDTGLS